MFRAYQRLVENVPEKLFEKCEGRCKAQILYKKQKNPFLKISKTDYGKKAN